MQMGPPESQEHRRAISGYVFMVDGGAVSWTSKKQELVTLSTAEYVAATQAAKEAMWAFVNKFSHTADTLIAVFKMVGAAPKTATPSKFVSLDNKNTFVSFLNEFSTYYHDFCILCKYSSICRCLC